MPQADEFFDQIKQMSSVQDVSLDDIRKHIETSSKSESSQRLTLFKPVFKGWGEEIYYAFESGLKTVPGVLIKSAINHTLGNPRSSAAIVLYDFNQMKRTILVNTDNKIQCNEKKIENQHLYALQYDGIPKSMMNNPEIYRPLQFLIG